MSYTTFGYSNLTVSAVSPSGQVQIGFDLTNTGGRTGAEVPQLYLGFPAAASEPPKQLKGFQKISLSPGQTQHVTFNLDWEDLANWDATARGWIVTPGTFSSHGRRFLARHPFDRGIHGCVGAFQRSGQRGAPPAGHRFLRAFHEHSGCGCRGRRSHLSLDLAGQRPAMD